MHGMDVRSGAKLNIVSTTTSFGTRTVASRIEVSSLFRVSRTTVSGPDASLLSGHLNFQIWDVTHHRLCASGVHNKMAPKLPTPTPEQAKL